MNDFCEKHDSVWQGIEEECPECCEAQGLCRTCGEENAVGVINGCNECRDAYGVLPEYGRIELNRPTHKALLARWSAWFLESCFLDAAGLAQLLVTIPRGEDVLFDRFRTESLLPQAFLDGVADRSIELASGVYLRGDTPVHVVDLAGQLVVWNGSPTQVPKFRQPEVMDEFDLHWEERPAGWKVCLIGGSRQTLGRTLAPLLTLEGYAVSFEPSEPALFVELPCGTATLGDEPDRFYKFPIEEYLAAVLTLIRQEGWRSMLDHSLEGSTSERAWNLLVERRQSNGCGQADGACHLDVLPRLGWIRTTENVAEGIHPALFENVRAACEVNSVDVVTCHMAALLVSPDVPAPVADAIGPVGDPVTGRFLVLDACQTEQDGPDVCVTMVLEGTANLVLAYTNDGEEEFPVGGTIPCEGVVRADLTTDFGTRLTMVYHFLVARPKLSYDQLLRVAALREVDPPQDGDDVLIAGGWIYLHEEDWAVATPMAQTYLFREGLLRGRMLSFVPTLEQVVVIYTAFGIPIGVTDE